MKKILPLTRSQHDCYPESLDKFRGCLLGGAVGDALGAAVEFMSYAEITSKFGPNGITDYYPAYGGLGTITDDTQMTLFTAEGLLRGWVRGRHKGITCYIGTTSLAYLRWLETQGIRSKHLPHGDSEQGWLIQHRELHSRRAPGATCLSSLTGMRDVSDLAQNDSKGCGGMMRIAPVGMFFWRLNGGEKLDETFQLGSDLAAITHGHPSGYLTGGVFAVLIQLLLEGYELTTALGAAKNELVRFSDHAETLGAIEAAEKFAASEISPYSAITKLGEGWVAEEALAISIYCTLVSTNLHDAIVLAVNHSGDSDSTGAITGNLMGAMLGAASIPSHLLEQLELNETISEIAQDLHNFVEWDIGEYSKNYDLNDRIWEKYPGI